MLQNNYNINQLIIYLNSHPNYGIYGCTQVRTTMLVNKYFTEIDLQDNLIYKASNIAIKEYYNKQHDKLI